MPSSPPPAADPHAAYVDAALPLLGLTAEGESRTVVLANMAVLADAARSLMEFPLDDALEPAPTFLP